MIITIIITKLSKEKYKINNFFFKEDANFKETRKNDRFFM